MQKLSKLEQETLINWDNSEHTAEIYTYDPKLKERLKAIAEYDGSVGFLKEDSWGALTCTVPKSFIKIKAPMKLTEEQRQTRRDSMLKNRAKINSNI